MRPLPAELQAHFDAPRNVGRLLVPALSGAAGNAACGDDLRVYAEIRSGCVARAAFQARACSAVIAVASLCIADLAGLPLERVASFDVAARVERAGGLGGPRTHAIAVVSRALAQLARPVGEEGLGCQPAPA